MDLKTRVEALEKKVGVNGNIEDARNLVNALLHLKIITPEEYDEKLEEAIKSGRGLKQVLDAVQGKTLGLPSEQERGEG
jgi:predicted nucleic acid-binding protein